MKITLLIPCHNEEKAIRTSIASWLNQTRPPDEIIAVDDASTDATPDILEEYKDKVKVVRTPVNLGNKSHAQEYGMQFVTGEMFVTTDADTILKEDFIELIEKDFKDPKVAAVGGYVRSLKYNWITRHRAFEYTVCQNYHKLAQSYMDCVFVIPGAAGAFRTDIFRKYLTFDHDTIAEDLDFTYKLHEYGLKVLYNREAIVFTQDPATLRCYINQLRRWFGGGWQNLMKHYNVTKRPAQVLELSFMYIEGIVFSCLLMILPFINLRFALTFLVCYVMMAFVLSLLASMKEKRTDIIFASFTYPFFLYLNAYLFLEQFVLEVLMKRKQMAWFTPERTPSTNV